MTTNLLSIVCPIFNEEKFIEKCIDSMLEQDYGTDNLEIILVDGMSTDKTRELIKPYLNKYAFIKLMENPNRTVPYAMNIGIRAAKGDVIIRLDAHCKYPTNYFSVLVDKLFELGADNVGGVWNTLPADDSAKCNTIAFCSSHWFGVGGSDHKIGASEIMEVDTVPFGCYRKEVFDKIGLYDEELTRNQDDELNARLINNGGKIFLIPQLVIDYTARNTFAKMCKMYYQYGLFKPLVNKKLGAPATIRQFIPPLFVLGLVFGAILSIFVPYLWIAFCGALALYSFAAFAIGLKAALQKHKIGMAFLVPFAFFLIHCSYGIGYWNGIFKLMLKRPFNVQSNH